MAGAGGVGNIGAEAIFLALVRAFQRRWPHARFVLSAWRPERVRALVADLPGDFRVIPQSVPLDPPRELRAADVFVVCGDVALTETVVPILPAYRGAKVLWARLFGAKAVFHLRGIAEDEHCPENPRSASLRARAGGFERDAIVVELPP
jgi:hypothetical protein